MFNDVPPSDPTSPPRDRRGSSAKVARPRSTFPYNLDNAGKCRYRYSYNQIVLQCMLDDKTESGLEDDGDQAKKDRWMQKKLR